jgi:hypothetical protein
MSEGPKQILDFIAKGGYKTSEAYKWASEVIKPVNIVSYRDLPIAGEIDYLIKNVLAPKECFKNAFLLLDIPGVEYVDGYTSCHGIPLEHAFNFYQGKYFDATIEGVLGREVFGENYWEIVKVDRYKLHDLLFKAKFHGPVFESYYFNYIKTGVMNDIRD